MIENTMKMICRILVRLALRYSLELTCFLFDFLFAISHLTLTCLSMAVAIAFSSSPIVSGFMT
jgi:hypothetical protein